MSWINVFNGFPNVSNGRANNSNVYSNASNYFSSRFNGFLTIYKRFEPLNVKALVYVFPWKVTYSKERPEIRGGSQTVDAGVNGLRKRKKCSK